MGSGDALEPFGAIGDTAMHLTMPGPDDGIHGSVSFDDRTPGAASSRT
jgi:hypothetical protein